MKTRCPYGHVQPYLVAMGDLHEDLLSIRSYSAVLGGYWRSVRILGLLTSMFSHAWWLWEICMKTCSPYGHVQLCLVAMGEL